MVNFNQAEIILEGSSKIVEILYEPIDLLSADFQLKTSPSYWVWI